MPLRRLKRDLGFLDLTAIVIGSIVGADIYVASSLSAGLLGPLSMFAWVVAGLFAMVIALVFAYCSYYVPKVGGPFAFVSKAFDDFWGFLTGWSLWIAEVLALAIFAIMFVNYLQYFIPLSFPMQVLIKFLFMFGLTAVNVVGVKAAGRLNEALTLLKLLPLVLIIVAGLGIFILNPAVPAANYTPLAPLGFGGFGAAIVLIFWAFVGFEMGTLPASEVRNPKKTIPKAIITGMLIITLFYLVTNFVIYGTVEWAALAATSTPLVLSATALLGAAGAVIISIGALVSVSGSDEANVLGTARLSYAMAIDGLFPKIFAKVHPKYGTPYMALLIQGAIGFALSIYSGIAGLISFSVFNLAFAFLLACLSLLILKRGSVKKLHGQSVLPWLGIVICLYLIWNTSMFDKFIGTALVVLAIPLYIFFSPKADMHHLKSFFLSEDEILARRLEHHEKFLAHFILLLHRGCRRLRKPEREV
ncbi:MAG: amino acid permease [Candidatus Aenigmarchaeota archaeon]|nr:amino acid permease [Candidatus Aenigmarchaeota archaeon]